jgi:Sulfotransferase domain
MDPDATRQQAGTSANLRVVGAGVGRTGTHSLKLALEQLLRAPCYHMFEVLAHPEHIAAWHAALRGEPVSWPALFTGYAAAVDWPAAALWRQLADAYPDALVLLSVRSDPEQWWRSFEQTIRAANLAGPGPAPAGAEFLAMATDMLDGFDTHWARQDAAIAAYQRHNDQVRRSLGDRVVVWQPEDGWTPLCAALAVPVPDTPFPHANTTSEFRQIVGLPDLAAATPAKPASTA